MHKSTSHQNRQPATCPDWCTAGPEHLDQIHLDDVLHSGPGMPGLALSDGHRTLQFLDARVFADTDEDGQPGPVVIDLHADADQFEGLELSTTDALEAISGLRGHLDRLEAFVRAQQAPAATPGHPSWCEPDRCEDIGDDTIRHERMIGYIDLHSAQIAAPDGTVVRMGLGQNRAEVTLWGYSFDEQPTGEPLVSVVLPDVDGQTRLIDLTVEEARGVASKLTVATGGTQ